ncbi:MAG: outer membrane beta-barrel protein [Candidatus Omnitrophica bacterium]|nr:outer membrane beta-barrel protein [Candidatus Omnitrophota bacterium]
MFKKLHLSLFIAPLSTLLFCGLLYAQIKSENLPDRTGVKAGPLIVHTALNNEIQFDTNVFLTNKEPQYDTVTIVNPSAGLELPFGDNIASVEYDAAINFFGRFPHQNYTDHRVQGLVEINLTDYKIKLDEVYRQFSSRAGSEDTNRVRQQTNNLRAGVSAEFEKLGFDVGYTFGIQDYISKEVIYQNLLYKDKDRLINAFDLTGSYRIAPKTTFLVEEDVGWLNYYSSLSSNSWYTETLAGLKGEVTSKIEANLKMGVRYQHYEKVDFSADKDFAGFVMRGGVRYLYTDDDIFELKLERANYESTYANMNYYTLNHAGLDYRHFFNKKVSGKLYSFYEFHSYPSQTTESGETDNRYDNFVGAGCALRYDMKEWLSFEADYDFTLRDSRFDNFNYVENLITIRGTIGF